MMKLKRIDGGMYCFLLTFDPGTEMVNIVDLQANNIGSLPPQPRKIEIQGSDKKAKQEPDDEIMSQKSSKIQAAKYVESQVQTELKSDDSSTKPATKAKVKDQTPNREESPKSDREFRPHDLLTRREAAAYLGISEQTLAIWKCTGRQNLPYLKIGRLVKYEVADLDAYLKRVKRTPESPPQESNSRSRSFSRRKVEF